jgi:hypothetical protein
MSVNILKQKKFVNAILKYKIKQLKTFMES